MACHESLISAHERDSICSDYDKVRFIDTDDDDDEEYSEVEDLIRSSSKDENCGSIADISSSSRSREDINTISFSSANPDPRCGSPSQASTQNETYSLHRSLSTATVPSQPQSPTKTSSLKLLSTTGLESSRDELCHLLAPEESSEEPTTQDMNAHPNKLTSLPTSPASTRTLPVICRSDDSDERLHPVTCDEEAPKRNANLSTANNKGSTCSSSGSESNNNNNNSNKKRYTAGVVQKTDATTRKQRKTRFTEDQPYGRRRFNSNFHNGRMSLPGCKTNRSVVSSRILCRNNSVQISSIRGGMDRLENVDRSKYLIPRIEYGGRLIDKKGGDSNVCISESSNFKLYSRYASDLFTTLIDMPLSYVLLMTLFVYVGHWILFGLMYWLFAHYNNDYEYHVNGTSSEHACVYDVYDFTTAFLYSMESETTIGYGTRGITTHCPHAIILLSIQCIVSAIFDTWIIGIVYQRFARPDARTKTTLFSKEAIITRRDGKRCLIVRVANLRKSLLVSTSIRARLISFRSALSDEKDVGYHVMSEQREVEFKNGDTLFFTAPVEYYHVIDKESPLYRVRPDQYDRCKKVYFELVVTFTGTLEATGMTMQAQTSYLNTDISYGKRYLPVLSRDVERGRYTVDFRNMNKTVDEPRHLYGQNAVDTHGGVPTGFQWESSVAMPLTEEDENEQMKNGSEDNNQRRIRVDTYTSDDVFEDSSPRSSKVKDDSIA